MSNELYNIEELLLDYLDGKLEKNEKAFVERYLANHPELAEEIAGLEDIKVSPQYELKYEHKHKLRRTKEFKLAVYAKWAIAASGALMIGALIWLSVENAGLKRDFASLQNKEIIQKKDSKSLQHADVQNQAIVSAEKPLVTEKKANKNRQSYNQNTVVKKRPYKSHINPNPGMQTALAQIVNTKETSKKKNSNSEDVKTLISLARVESLEELKYKEIPELKTESSWENPVLIGESTVVVFTEMEHVKSLIESIIPFELARVEAKLKSKLRDVTTENIKDKLKNAFQFNKLKEALVPSSVQENLTSLQ